MSLVSVASIALPLADANSFFSSVLFVLWDRRLEKRVVVWWAFAVVVRGATCCSSQAEVVVRHGWALCELAGDKLLFLYLRSHCN
jgi:hypothetical protein